MSPDQKSPQGIEYDGRICTGIELDWFLQRTGELIANAEPGSIPLKTLTALMQIANRYTSEAGLNGVDLNHDIPAKPDVFTRQHLFKPYITELPFPPIPNGDFHGFQEEFVGRNAGHLFRPGLIIPPQLQLGTRLDARIDALGQKGSFTHYGPIPSLQAFVTHRKAGIDPTVNPTNRALIELSNASIEHAITVADATPIQQAFLSAAFSLTTDGFWNANQARPGGNILSMVNLDSSGGVHVSDLMHLLSKDALKSLGSSSRVRTYFSQWMRTTLAMANRTLVLYEGNPFNGKFLSDPSVGNLAEDLKTAHHYFDVPALSQSEPRAVLEELTGRESPLGGYRGFIRLPNVYTWLRFIEEPGLIETTAETVEHLKGLPSVLFIGGTDSGKSQLVKNVTEDMRTLSMAPESGGLLTISGNNVRLDIPRPELIPIKADSPGNLLIHTYEAGDTIRNASRSRSVVLMEIPPCIELGPADPEAQLPRHLQAINDFLGHPAAVVSRLRASKVHDSIIMHESRDIAHVSSITLSRLAQGNVSGLVFPIRDTAYIGDLIADLQKVKVKGPTAASESWDAAQTLTKLSAIFSLLPPDIKVLYWLSMVTHTPLIPMLREFPDDLLVGTQLNSTLAGSYYLMSLHNLGLLHLEPQDKDFARNVARELPDGTLSVTSLARKYIPATSPVYPLLEVASHIRDNLHGSGRQITQEFLSGLAICLEVINSKQNEEKKPLTRSKKT